MKDTEYQPKRSSDGGRRREDYSSDVYIENEDKFEDTYESYKREVRSGSIVPGIIITLVLLASTLFFDVYMTITQMVPLRILVPIYIILFLLVLLVALLVSNSGRRGRFFTGLGIAVVLAAVLIYGAYAVSLMKETVEDISGYTIQTTHVGVYVLVNDSAETLNDLESDTFGILCDLDRGNTDLALDQLNAIYEDTAETAEYVGLDELVDALYDRECGAILLNSGYLDVIEDMEGYEDIDDRIREVDSIDVEEEIKTADISTIIEDDTFVVYISGIDSRNGLVAKSRSDSNILAVVNLKTHQVLLINTPRDYFVPLSISNGQEDKLTHAGIYGVDVSMDTMSMLYDTDVDYYFRVNFSGFSAIIDALGSITVNSEVSFTTGSGTSNVKEAYTFVVGENEMDGAKALAFARERYSLSGGDNQRGRNQMAIIEGVIDKIMSPEILLTYSDILSAVSGQFETSMPYELIASLVSDQLNSGASWDIQSYSVTGTGANKKPYSMSTTAYVMIPDENSVQVAKDLIAQMESGEMITVPDAE